MTSYGPLLVVWWSPEVPMLKLDAKDHDGFSLRSWWIFEEEYAILVSMKATSWWIFEAVAMVVVEWLPNGNLHNLEGVCSVDFGIKEWVWKKMIFEGYENQFMGFTWVSKPIPPFSHPSMPPSRHLVPPTYHHTATAPPPPVSSPTLPPPRCRRPSCRHSTVARSLRTPHHCAATTTPLCCYHHVASNPLSCATPHRHQATIVCHTVCVRTF